MLDLETLLQPIRAGQPCGDDLAFAPELDAIAAARQSDDPTLDQGAWQTDRREADWRLVARECSRLLRERSKDLRLAVWLTEAMASQAPETALAHLAQGLQLVQAMVERYWDQGLWPALEDGDPEQRVGNLRWLLARIPDLLQSVALTDSQPGCAPRDLDAALRREGSDGPGMLALESARQASSPAFRSAFAEAATACATALTALEATLDARLGADSPGFSKVRDALERLVVRVPKPARANDEPARELVLAAGASPGMAPAHSFGANPTMAPVTRAQAVRQLREIATYFRAAEPHNPAGYFAEKAAQAAEQDLHTWLRRTLRDPGALAHIEEMLGIGAAPA